MADGTPKLLDFSIAKLLDPEHAGNTIDPDHRRLTPRYASLERFLSKSVATTSDVYGLGVILYEGFKPIRGTQSPEMVEACQSLINLYEAWGKPEQAQRLQTN